MKILLCETVHINHSELEIIIESIGNDTVYILNDDLKYESKDNAYIFKLATTFKIPQMEDKYHEFTVVSMFKPYDFPCDDQCIAQMSSNHFAHAQALYSSETVKELQSERLLLPKDELLIQRIKNLVIKQEEFIKSLDA